MSTSFIKKTVARSAGIGVLAAVAMPAAAQTTTGASPRGADPVTGNVTSSTTYQAPRVIDQTGQTLGQTSGQLGNTVGQVGNTVGNVAGGLQPTLQPVTQGAGNALNNLTQPETVSSLLEFLAGVIPNHIEAHVNLDALQIEKVTLDIQGVDLRNLRVDLLVANSRNAGQVRPAMGPNSTTGANAGNSSTNSTGSNNTGITVPSLSGTGSGATATNRTNTTGGTNSAGGTANR